MLISRSKTSGFTLLLLVALFSASPDSANAMSIFKKSGNSFDFFAYPRNELSGALEKAGFVHSGFWSVTRNNSADALILINRNSKTALSVRCDGSISDLKMKGDMGWFDDQLDLVAWSDNKGNTRFSNGHTKTLKINPFIFDYSSSYFLNEIEDAGKGQSTALFSSDEPDVRKWTFELTLANSRVFVKDNTIYVIGPDKSDFNVLLIYILNQFDEKLVLSDLKKLVRPSGSRSTLFGISDLSPYNDMIVVRDVRDGPFGDQFYQVDLKTLKMDKIGVGGFGLYTQCDFINTINGVSK